MKQNWSPVRCRCKYFHVKHEELGVIVSIVWYCDGWLKDKKERSKEDERKPDIFNPLLT